MKTFFKSWRPYLFYGAFFSMFINVLQLTFPIYMLQIYDRVLSSYSMSTLFVLTIAAVASLIIMAALEFIRSRLLVRCGVAIDQAISRNVLDEVLKSSALAEGNPQSEATLRDVSLLRNFFAGNAIFALFDIPWTPLFLAVIYFLHPLMGLVATAGAVLLVVFGVINELVSRKPLEQASVSNAMSMNFVETARRNGQLVRSMGMLGGVTKRWESFNDSFMNLQTEASRKAGLIQALSSWLRQSMQVFIYGVGAWLTLKGESTAGVMIASSIIMGRALAPVQMGMATWKQMIEARGAWTRLNEMFKNRSESVKMDLPAPTGQLEVEHVGLSIKGNVILDDVSFALEPGESLGVIGPSGAGKSTLCRLLLGIWPATSGVVRMDGADIYTWDQEKLGPYIGYLPQDIELFSGTVAENIARLEELDSEKVIAAAQTAGVHEMILNFPKGYDTLIGAGGIILSGGQRQRIGLARALYGNPKLVVLDEPNSNLDEAGEVALLASWPKLKAAGTTLVVVTHKPSLMAGVDKVLVMANGKLAIFGPRDEVYKKLTELNAQRQAAPG